MTMSVREAAEVLGVGRNTLYDAVARGEIPCVRIGHRVLIARRTVDELVGGAA